MDGQQTKESIPTLLSDALSQFATLFQNEVDLAKAELTQKAQRVGVAAGLFAAGALFVIPAIVMALFALSAALIRGGWSDAAAYLISATVAALLATMMLVGAMRVLDLGNLKPWKTIHQLEKDKQTLKGFVR